MHVFVLLQAADNKEMAPSQHDVLQLGMLDADTPGNCDDEDMPSDSDSEADALLDGSDSDSESDILSHNTNNNNNCNNNNNNNYNNNNTHNNYNYNSNRALPLTSEQQLANLNKFSAAYIQKNNINSTYKWTTDANNALESASLSHELYPNTE